MAAHSPGVSWAAGLEAVSTAVAAAAAIAAGLFAVMAFRRQGQQLSLQREDLRQQAEELSLQRTAQAEQARVLKLQADDLRESLDRRRRANQAAEVSLEVAKDVDATRGDRLYVKVTTRIENNSPRPIRQLQTLMWFRDKPELVNGWPRPYGDDFDPGRMETRAEGFVEDPTIGEDEIHVAVVFYDHYDRRWVLHEGNFLRDITGLAVNDYTTILATRVVTARQTGYRSPRQVLDQPSG
jgi:hypothetical protein